MKTSILTAIFCIGTIIFATGSISLSSAAGEGSFQESVSQTVYTCPMHPEVVQGKTGKCPKCGMNLTSKKVSELYTCSMHPEVIQVGSGKCPKCGMNLTSKPIDQFCICSMHSEIVQFKSGKCPKCGMKSESAGSSK